MSNPSNSADKCREEGWQAGDVLDGDDKGFGPKRIVITAIGDECVLARVVGDHGVTSSEGICGLLYRGWRKVDSEQF